MNIACVTVIPFADRKCPLNSREHVQNTDIGHISSVLHVYLKGEYVSCNLISSLIDGPSVLQICNTNAILMNTNAICNAATFTNMLMWNRFNYSEHICGLPAYSLTLDEKIQENNRTVQYYLYCKLLFSTITYCIAFLALFFQRQRAS